MFERLNDYAKLRAAAICHAAIERISRSPAPAGVTVEAIGNGILLSGRKLKRRAIEDPRLRDFGR